MYIYIYVYIYIYIYIHTHPPISPQIVRVRTHCTSQLLEHLELQNELPGSPRSLGVWEVQEVQEVLEVRETARVRVRKLGQACGLLTLLKSP